MKFKVMRTILYDKNDGKDDDKNLSKELNDNE